MRGSSPFGSPEQIADAAILYASLDDQRARRENVCRNIGSRVRFAFVRCIDGRAWTEEETNSRLSDQMRQLREKSLREGKTWLASGAIACAISHRENLIGNIRDKGKVLCEDDAVIKDAFLNHIADGSAAEVLDALDGIAMLHYISPRPVQADRAPVAQIGNYTVHRANPKGLASAASYFVPANIAPRIKSFQSPLRVSVDHWDLMIDGGAFANLYVIHPAPARVGDFPTTINYGVGSKNKILDRLRHIRLLRRIKWVLGRASHKYFESITEWS